MDKFSVFKLEELKLQYYSIIGKLEIVKDIVVSDDELRLFEENLEKCQTEEDALSLILGGIRRYKILLQSAVLPNLNPGVESNVEEITMFPESSVEQTTMYPFVEVEMGESSISLTVESSMHNISNQVAAVQEEEDSVVGKVFTNSVCFKEMDDNRLTTTRERNSLFMVYDVNMTRKHGCEFTLKKRCKEYNRHECKLCRKIVNKEKKTIAIPMDQQPAAIKVVNGDFVGFLKEKHNDSCYVEPLGTAYARSGKNICVQFKAKYGATAKQAYDSHSRKLMEVTGNVDVTMEDFAEGFKTFDSAKGALNKSGKRKTATPVPNMLNPDGTVNKIATILKKVSPNDKEEDYFLIGESTETGTIVLGSKQLAKLLFVAIKVASDGTFKSAPNNYAQVYIIWSILHCQIEGEFVERSKAVPGIYIFLKGKTQALYHEAFSMIETYRKENGLPTPNWASYLLDDEKAVQNIIIELYPWVDIELCYFHVNKNIVKCLVKNKLTHFVRNCKTDVELWFYGKLKQILVLPLLPLTIIHDAFTELKKKIVSFFEYNFGQGYQLDLLNTFFDKVEENYYGNEEKMAKICKYRKTIRGTNLLEAAHGGFNKSVLIPKNGKLNNHIYGFKCIDYQYQAVSIDYSKRGGLAFPKKTAREQNREKQLAVYYQQLEDEEISTEIFLELVSELWIHKKYHIMIKEATKVIENGRDVESSTANEDIIDEDVIDDFIDAIFVNENPPKRIRKLCTKYYGEVWDNS